jgi:hypothetical protein
MLVDSDRVLLNYYIEQEKAKKAYRISEHDAFVLKQMLEEINGMTGSELRFLSELALFSVKGSGETVKKYIDSFDSEEVRSYLLHHMVSDRIKDCDKLIYNLYLHFKESSNYIPPPGQPGPLAIYGSYDNAFRRLKPKRIKKELLSLAYNPRDAFYLSFTMRMLASWRIPELECLFTSYVDGTNVTPESVGLPTQFDNYYPPFSFIKRQLRFTGIYSLKYYPSESTIKLMENCINEPDKDICSAAKSAMNYIEMRLKKRL